MKKLLLLLCFALPAICWIVSCNQAAPGATTDNVQTDSSRIAHGAYLVTILGCGDCHSPKNMGPMGPAPDPALLLSGYPADRPRPAFPTGDSVKGFAVMNYDLTATSGPWGVTYAANLTPDATGIEGWTEDQFNIALTQGKSKGLANARPLMPPMPWENYKSMKREDVNAIFAYLKSIKPVKNLVPAIELVARGK